MPRPVYYSPCAIASYSSLVLLQLIALMAHAADEQRSPTYDLKTYTAYVKKELPHAGAPWTQGLEIAPDNNMLVEAAGAFPPGSKSFVRVIDPTDGKVINTITDGFEKVFLEGLSAFNTPQGKTHWFVTTYTNKQAFELDENLNIVNTTSYPLTGWGFARGTDTSHLLVTDGSATMSKLDRATMTVIDRFSITCMGKQVSGVNELEYVENFMGEGPRLLGNIMNTRSILVMDPDTGKCTGSFHLHNVSEPYYEQKESGGFHVANGIAYNKATDTFFVTGKQWNSMYEISLEKNMSNAVPAGTISAADLLAKHLVGAPAVGHARHNDSGHFDASLRRHPTSTPPVPTQHRGIVRRQKAQGDPVRQARQLHTSVAGDLDAYGMLVNNEN